jgi:hypothetical protein
MTEKILVDLSMQSNQIHDLPDPGAAGDAARKAYVDAQVATRIASSEKGAVNGVATLGADGLIPQAQIPAIAITDTFVVASEAAMLALSAEVGDLAIRTDISKSFVLAADPASTLANWQEIISPGAAVLSVDGLTGSVVLKVSFTIGDGSSVAFNIDHNWNDRDVMVEVWENGADYATVICDVQRPTVNRITLVFNNPPASNAYRVTLRR